MTIYVDHAMNRLGRMKMSHMMTNSNLDELHQFAKRIGLKREWFQNHPIHPHYDISESKRKIAIQNGAIPISSEGLLMLCSNISQHRSIKE